MKTSVLVAGVVGALSLYGASAQAAIAINGVLDPAFGAPIATVNYNPSAPESNFGSPTNQSDAIAYNIWATSDSSNVYVYLKTFGPGTAVGNFANLYFDITPSANDGSDLGFEVTNKDAFIPGVSGNVPVNIDYYAANGIVEAAIPLKDFTSAIAGLNYNPGQAFPVIGDQIELRLSQSFGYSVAGGPDYGPDRLGMITLGGAVPEPMTWALMIVGLAGIGTALRHRRSLSATA